MADDDDDMMLTVDDDKDSAQAIPTIPIVGGRPAQTAEICSPLCGTGDRSTEIHTQLK